VLVLQPIVRLRPATRYVAVVRGLSRPGARPSPRCPASAPCVTGVVDDASPRASERARFQQILAFLDRVNIDAKDVQVAWDFTTAAMGPVTGRLLRMRDGAWETLPPAGGAPYTSPR